ncbi:MAG: NYN domain-containing protein [Candidatus Bathyarchaeia archaeon]
MKKASLLYDSLPEGETILLLGQKVMIFVDGSNLLHSAIQAGVKLDYDKLRTVLVGDGRLVRAYWFGSYREGDKKQERFYEMLKKRLGYDVTIYKTQRRIDGRTGREYYREKGVDVALVTEMLQLGFLRAYDTCILVAGDADYARAVEVVKRQGLVVIVAAFRANLASRLIEVTPDKIVYLDDIIDHIKL